MKSKEIKNFFDTHAHYSAYNKNPDYYLPIISSLSKSMKSNLKILDIGCGDGSFLKGLRKAGLDGSFIGIDISFNLIKKAHDNVIDHGIHLLVTDGFNLPFNQKEKFDLIHIDSVLHHLIGKTRYHSLELSKKLLKVIYSALSPNGLIIVEEMYYNSRLLPFFTSSFVFYALRAINASKIDLSRIRSEVKPGLEVSFFYEQQLKDILNKYGDVEILSKIPSKISNLEKTLLLKERGHISYLVKTY